MPSSDVATAYLRRLAFTEGHAVAEEDVKALYEGGKTLDLACFSHGLAAYSVCPTPSTPDLRRAINALQFLCLGYPGLSDPASAESDAVRQQIMPADDSSEMTYVYDPQLEVAPTEAGDMSPRSSVKQMSSDLQRLWRLSDSYSGIDSALSRRPAAFLEVRFFAYCYI